MNMTHLANTFAKHGTAVKLAHQHRLELIRCLSDMLAAFSREVLSAPDKAAREQAFDTLDAFIAKRAELVAADRDLYLAMNQAVPLSSGRFLHAGLIPLRVALFDVVAAALDHDCGRKDSEAVMSALAALCAQGHPLQQARMRADTLADAIDRELILMGEANV